MILTPKEKLEAKQLRKVEQLLKPNTYFISTDWASDHFADACIYGLAVLRPEHCGIIRNIKS